MLYCPCMKATAIEEYCRYVDELAGSESEPSSQSSEYKDIAVTDKNGVRTILLNRPSKYNALTYQVNSSTVV